LPRDEWERLSSVFSKIEKLETKLEQEGAGWPEKGRKQDDTNLDREPHQWTSGQRRTASLDGGAPNKPVCLWLPRSSVGASP